MATETLTMPQLGESVTEGTVLQWFKQPGDAVALDEPLVEIETEKVTVEMPSPIAGTLQRILVQVGETVPVDAPLAEFEVGAEAAPAPTPEPTPEPEPEPVPEPQPEAEPPIRMADEATSVSRAEPEPTPEPEPEPVPEPEAKPEPTVREAPQAAPAGERPPGTYQRRRFSPAVARLAREHDIDPASIAGTGAGGRVTRRDVEKALRSGTAPATTATHAERRAPAAATPATADEVVAFSPTRRRIAQRMTQSAREIPAAWLLVEADASGLVQLRRAAREEFRARHGVDLPYDAFVVQAVAAALSAYPDLNCVWDGDDLIRRGERNIGIAVDTDAGLVVPVIRGADGLGLPGLAAAIDDLASRARERRLRLEDVEGGTFTVDNTGIFGTVATRPIINYPQVAILTTEAIVKRPVVLGEDAIAVRSMMNLSLTFDHRVLDGSTAAAFARDVRDRLQALTPDRDLA